MALERPMLCDPGTCWSYAHTNFVILGKVLEKAAGRPLEDLIREGILDRLSLNDTRSETTAVIQAPVLHSFDAERGKYEESTYWNPSWTLAHGAIMTSNIADILKSAAAIGTGTLLSPDPRAATRATDRKFKPWSETTYYGLGSTWSMAGSCRIRRLPAMPRPWRTARASSRSPFPLPWATRHRWGATSQPTFLRKSPRIWRRRHRYSVRRLPRRANKQETCGRAPARLDKCSRASEIAKPAWQHQGMPCVPLSSSSSAISR